MLIVKSKYSKETSVKLLKGGYISEIKVGGWRVTDHPKEFIGGRFHLNDKYPFIASFTEPYSVWMTLVTFFLQVSTL